MEQIKINRAELENIVIGKRISSINCLLLSSSSIVLYCSTLIYFNEMDSFLFESLIEIWLVTPQ